jgi:Mannitol dehydrogenase Rossmann domain
MLGIVPGGQGPVIWPDLMLRRSIIHHLVEINNLSTGRHGMPDSVQPHPLNARTLPYWSGRLPVPTYDRNLVTTGVVHFGVGGFHRAHQAMYHDRLMNEGMSLD